MNVTCMLPVLALASAASSSAQTATMPPHASGFNILTRGYWFTAPTDFTMTGVRVLADPTSNFDRQNFSIVRFDNETPPPAYPSNTNAFEQLGFGFDRPLSQMQTVDIAIEEGDIVGVFGNSALGVNTTFGRASYANGNPPRTVIAGFSVDLIRTGMQAHLGSATTPAGMQNVWADPTTNEISRVEFTYEIPIGVSYCGPAVPNSTGTAGVMGASGSTSISTNQVSLRAWNLPHWKFGMFVTSRTAGFSPGAGGASEGNLCLGGTIGRFDLAGQLMPTGIAGRMELAIDLRAMPEGGAFVAVPHGQAWHFQAWYRDSVGTGSNFTDGLQIRFP